MRKSAMNHQQMVYLLMAGAIGFATVKAMPGTGGTCKGNVGSLLDQCDLDNSCFNTEAGQMVIQSGAPLSPWLIGIQQCIKGSSISFITWAPSVNGQCDYDAGAGTPNCGSNKLEEIPSGAIFIDDATVPYGSCTGEPICVYVHDGQLGKGKEGLPEPNVPPSCYSSANQLCAMCGPFLVTPTLPDNSFCDDGFSCTEETCQSGVCVPVNIPGACNDDTTCTDDVCVAGGNDPTITDAGPAGSGCGYKDNGSCDDGFTCTADLCVALPSVGASAGSPAADANGCFFDKAGGVPCIQPRECAVVECAADASTTSATGCVYTEKQDFCKNKYGPCAQAVCADADGQDGYSAGTTYSDGCSVPAPSVADAACAHLESALECGVYVCNLTPGFTPGTSGCEINAGPTYNGACETLHPGQGCQISTCGTGGVCGFENDNSFCAANNPFGPCVTPVCAPGTPTAAANGCGPGAVVPNACGLDTANGEDCGSSICNAVTGECQKNSVEVGAQCSACDVCEANVCTSSCDLSACETCDTYAHPPQCTGTCPPDCSSLPVACDATCEECGFDSTGNSACLVKPSAPASCLPPDCSAAPCDTACEDCVFDMYFGTSSCVLIDPAPAGCEVGPPVCTPACSTCETCELVNGLPTCVGGCNECQLCNAGVCQPDPATLAQPCVGPGGLETCACSDQGECNFCRQECMFRDAAPGDDVFRGCAETSDQPAASNCGSRCSELCRQKCGGTDEYPPSVCSNVMGGNCKGVFSVFDSTNEFTGPCCKCDAVCP